MNQQTMSREDTLVAAVLSVCQLRDMWQESGQPRITNQLAEAIDDLVATYNDGDIPGECRSLFLVYPVLQKEWEQFAGPEGYASDKNPSPRPSLWRALEAMERLLIIKGEDYVPPMLETVSELVEQKVTYQQIAKIYSYATPTGYVGPFARGGKLLPQLVAVHWKWETGAKDVDGNPTGQRIIPPNFTHPEHAARLQASHRVEKRLAERASRLLGGEEGSILTDVGASQVDYDVTGGPRPPTRAELDALERNENHIPETEIADSILETINSDDPARTLQTQGDEAVLVEQILALNAKAPNTSHREIAEACGTTVAKVKEIIRNKK